MRVQGERERKGELAMISLAICKGIPLLAKSSLGF